MAEPLPAGRNRAKTHDIGRHPLRQGVCVTVCRDGQAKCAIRVPDGQSPGRRLDHRARPLRLSRPAGAAGPAAPLQDGRRRGERFGDDHRRQRPLRPQPHPRRLRGVRGRRAADHPLLQQRAGAGQPRPRAGHVRLDGRREDPGRAGRAQPLSRGPAGPRRRGLRLPLQRRGGARPGVDHRPQAVAEAPGQHPPQRRDRPLRHHRRVHPPRAGRSPSQEGAGRHLRRKRHGQLDLRDRGPAADPGVRDSRLCGRHRRECPDGPRRALASRPALPPDSAPPAMARRRARAGRARAPAAAAAAGASWSRAAAHRRRQRRRQRGTSRSP